MTKTKSNKVRAVEAYCVVSKFRGILVHTVGESIGLVKTAWPFTSTDPGSQIIPVKITPIIHKKRGRR
jgi:hypothetical protein